MEDTSLLWMKLELDTQSKEYLSLRLNNQWYHGRLYENDIAVRNVAEGIWICDHRVALKYTNFIRFFIKSDETFKIRNLNSQRIWIIDYKNSKLFSNEIVQDMRRIWTTVVIDNDDKYVHLGYTTGDIVAIDIQNYYLKHFGPVKDKDKLQAGISQLELFISGDKEITIFVGIVNGEIAQKDFVLGKITIFKIQPLGYGLATKTKKRQMSTKQTGSKKTAVPTRRPPRKVDVNGRVVPIATAERSLIPRQKDATRPSGPSCDFK
ncbi:MAG: hypothetical protein EZS28_030323 [Streblomastix strix]|uniref:Uncharacterized protein n=1 Tax=Streblomastix strix TaxID=222440 RepID=A0A5J4UUP8_9EUKA|nr:MAG: hypothetical protein EZS28_030323 [Streblomastix strix]